MGMSPKSHTPASPHAARSRCHWRSKKYCSRFSAAIAGARLVACPGCYPTSVQLGLIPLLARQLVDPEHLIASAASGVSGAGRQAKIDNLLSEVADSFKAYGVAGHRHLPEIRQVLGWAIGEEPGLTFVPHLVPMIRGILATLYARATQDVDLQALYEERYRSEPFVDLMPAGSLPETRNVRGSNRCQIAVHRPQDGDTLVVLSAIDKVANRVEICLDFVDQQRPDHIEDYRAAFKDMLDLTAECFDALHRALDAYFDPRVDIDELRQHASQVSEIESEIDEVQRTLTSTIFRSDLELAEKQHLAQLLRHIARVSDQIENATDELELLSVKSII